MAKIKLTHTDGTVHFDKEVSGNKFTITKIPYGDYTLDVKTDTKQGTQAIKVNSPNQVISVSITPIEGLEVETYYRSTEKRSIPNFNPTNKLNLVTDFGAVGDGQTDNFNALKNAIMASKDEPIELFVPSGQYMYQGPTNARMELWPNKSKGIKLVGEVGSVLTPVHNRDYEVHEHYAGQLEFEDTAKFEMKNIIIDGSLNPLDFYKTHGFGTENNNKIPYTRGLSITGASEVVVSNCEIRNLYGGYGLIFNKFEQVDIIDVNMPNCGGNNWTESFGMALYFGGHTTDAVVNIENVQASGITDPEIPKQMGWIGVVLENGTIQLADQTNWARDKNTEINITNSSFMDYETTYHAESAAGNVYWNSDNVKSRTNNYFIHAGVWGELKERSNLMDIELLPFGRTGIIKGLYYSENERSKNVNGKNDMRMYNSTVTYNPVSGYKDIEQTMAYADSVRGKFYHCTFNNVNDRLVSNASANFTNCEINLKSDNPNSETQLRTNHNRYFNNFAEQTLEFTNTNINRAGAWREAVPLTTRPPKVVNTGYVAPYLDRPISAATLQREG